MRVRERELMAKRGSFGEESARSWKYFDAATADPQFPGVTPRDAEALRELKALGGIS